MKTNQLFNFKRFARYAKSTLALNFKQTMMMGGVIVISIFIISLIAMAQNTSQWNKEGWIPVFIVNYFVVGIIYAGFAFSQFRSKEKTIMSLMVPVTPFERFLYEFIEKIASFILLYPILFWVFSSLAVFVRNSIPFEYTKIEVNGFKTFPFEIISYQQPIANTEDGLILMFFTLSVFLFIIAFAGAATFRKYPLVKTIVFVGAVLGIMIGYITLIFEKVQLRNGWIMYLEHSIKAEQGFMLGSIVLMLMSLIALFFAYFKLKEKEVS